MKDELLNYNVDNNSLVAKIEVEKLFYSYSYILQPIQTIGPESGRILLLYGNNGSGKTTILSLLFHLLHPEPYDGHRSFIGSIPFRKFTVHLQNGIIISALRLKTCDPGEYEIRIKNPQSDKIIRWKWQKKEKTRQAMDEKYKELCNFLTQLDISLHYLRDSRHIGNNNEYMKHYLSRELLKIRKRTIFLENDEEDDDESFTQEEKQLNLSIEAAFQWFRQRALSATNVGYTSVNSIYRDIINRIVTVGIGEQVDKSTTLDKLIEALIALKEKNSKFSYFGLTPDIDIQDIINNLNSAKSYHISLLNTVLEPFLEGYYARLDALRELQEVMNSFVSILNRFYSNKIVNVHLQKGLNITCNTGHNLKPTKLSSGEKQLLLLFCNAISSRKNRSILIIDEPEISLNVRWQRELIPALITCMSGTVFQLILATHSIEILARYEEYVVSLDNVIKGELND